MLRSFIGLLIEVLGERLINMASHCALVRGKMYPPRALFGNYYGAVGLINQVIAAESYKLGSDNAELVEVTGS